MKENVKYALERGKIANVVRDVLAKRDFQEVMTPILRNDDCKINRRYQTNDGHFLRDCYELPIRRLLSQEVPRVFELGPCFRPYDGNDATHLQEFYMAAIYALGQSTGVMKDITEDIVRKAIPWEIKSKIISMRDFIKDDLGMDIAVESTDELICKLVEKYHYSSTARAHVVVETYIEKVIEPLMAGLDSLYFLTDYPTCTLAVSARVDGLNYIKRFECYIDHLEIGHASVGCLDPDDMYQRLVYADMLGLEEEQQIDLLRYNLIAQNVGYGIGIDRLCMVKLREGV